jgi:uncharacterized protein
LSLISSAEIGIYSDQKRSGAIPQKCSKPAAAGTTRHGISAGDNSATLAMTSGDRPRLGNSNAAGWPLGSRLPLKGLIMGKIRSIVLIGVMLIVGGGVSNAGPLDDGFEAYQRGDYATALRLFRPLAEHGNPFAQFSLGVMYRKGQGVARDLRGAANWYRVAAEQGDALAQFSLGLMYYGGEGVTQDHREAVKWFRLAAEQGDASGQFNLGAMYRGGQGVTQDYREAVKWFRPAAEQGHAKAQFNLGEMYNNGQGVTQDYGEALKWFRLAAEQGIAFAQGDIGLMYAKGNGVVQDYLRAHMWINLATSRLTGDDAQMSAKKRDFIAKSLTPAQIVRAQEMAKQCEASGFKNCD